MTTPTLPVGYPVTCEREFVLPDGRRVHLRPVVPGDVGELRRAFERADRETLRRRFLGGGPPTSEAALLRLVTVDYERRFAVAAFAPDGTGIGIARYECEWMWPQVEVAVAVDTGWRGQGLGRELVAVVVRRAVALGASGLTADFYADNQRVKDLLAEAGLPERRTVDRGVVQEAMAFEGPGLAGLIAAGG